MWSDLPRQSNSVEVGKIDSGRWDQEVGGECIFGSVESLTLLSHAWWFIRTRQGNGLVHRPSD